MVVFDLLYLLIATTGRICAPCGKRVFGRRHLRVRCLTCIRGGPLEIEA